MWIYWQYPMMDEKKRNYLVDDDYDDNVDDDYDGDDDDDDGDDDDA